MISGNNKKIIKNFNNYIHFSQILAQINLDHQEKRAKKNLQIDY